LGVLDIQILMAVAVPIIGAMVTGGLIGAERTYNGHPAGFRTHILVALASCVLMLAAMHQANWAFIPLPGQTLVIDPTRMAHGILTGIGFLCAGVIFRKGFSVHGLTTAASLWITSAIGVLFGVGMLELALLAAFATLSVLAILRLVDARLPQVSTVDIEMRWIGKAAPDEPALRALMAEFGLKTLRIGHEISDGDRWHDQTIKVRGQSPLRIGALIERLKADTNLHGFSVTPHDD
jgi:putative Mg2+ transporter-C (MgtC) family protein